MPFASRFMRAFITSSNTAKENGFLLIDSVQIEREL